MSFESGGSWSGSERRQLEEHDRVIESALKNPEASSRLLQLDAIMWMKGAIALNTERGASEVTDRELLVGYMEYGRIEWDPVVAQSVARYLKDLGFSWSP